jgi:hypothetical protein
MSAVILSAAPLPHTRLGSDGAQPIHSCIYKNCASQRLPKLRPEQLNDSKVRGSIAAQVGQLRQTAAEEPSNEASTQVRPRRTRLGARRRPLAVATPGSHGHFTASTCNSSTSPEMAACNMLSLTSILTRENPGKAGGKGRRCLFCVRA